jgi:ribosomal protein S18 acetylase RimI-like enzyme
VIGRPQPQATLIVRPFEPADENAVIELWRACNLIVPWNDPARDIACKMKVNPELFLVAVEAERIVGTVMVGYDGHRGWINYLGVAPDQRRRGIGRLLMQEAETRLRALGCPKINLQVRTSNTEVIEFYRRIGFKEDPVVSFGKRLSP